MMSILYDEDVIRKNYMKEIIGEIKARDAKGIVELGKELGWSDEETLKRLQQILQISQGEAKKYLEMFNRMVEIETVSNDEFPEQIRPAIESMLENAKNIAEGKAEYETYEEVFATEN